VANYNGKDKTIGVATFDLAVFLNNGKTQNGVKSEKSRLVFQKCFDKNSSITF